MGGPRRCFLGRVQVLMKFDVPRSVEETLERGKAVDFDQFLQSYDRVTEVWVGGRAPQPDFWGGVCSFQNEFSARDECQLFSKKILWLFQKSQKEAFLYARGAQVYIPSFCFEGFISFSA